MDEDISKLKKILEQQRDQILLSAKKSLDELSSKDREVSGDEGDQAQNMEQQHLSIRFKERDRQLLRKIEESLNKIKNGTYGECEDCGNMIGTKRLEIRPVATLCVRCKEIAEKKEKNYSNENKSDIEQ